MTKFTIRTDASNRYVQRLSVYIQIKDGLPRTPSDLDIKDPYTFVKKVKKELSSNGNIKPTKVPEKRDDNSMFDNGKIVAMIDLVQKPDLRS